MARVVIAGLTAFVAFEKLAPLGRYCEPVSGAFMTVAGLWMLVR